MIDDRAIHEIVNRLARPTASGDRAIERAAILAEGSNCSDIEAWIVRMGGEPQGSSAAPLRTGLHADRINAGFSPEGAAPTRYLLPAESLALTDLLDEVAMEATGIEPAGPEQIGV
jgi:hypothetical protein